MGSWGLSLFQELGASYSVFCENSLRHSNDGLFFMHNTSEYNLDIS